MPRTSKSVEEKPATKRAMVYLARPDSVSPRVEGATYQVDGHNVFVPYNRPKIVPEFLAKIMMEAGDIESYSTTD